MLNYFGEVADKLFVLGTNVDPVGPTLGVNNHLSVSLITDITHQARQAISDEAKVSQVLSWRDWIKVIEVIKLTDKCFIRHCLVAKIIQNTDLCLQR